MHIAAPSYLPLNKYAPLRTVVTIYDMTTRTHPETHTPQNIAAWEQIFTFAQQRYAPIVTVSEWAKAEICTILQIPTAQVTVISSAPRPTTRHIPPGNEREQLLSVLPEIAESPFVLYAGNVEPRKNLKRLIMAFALAQSERKGIQLHKLVIAGSGSPEYVTELQQVAEESGIADAVVFTGYLSDEILNALMSACSVFAYVSLSEGFGIPPLEAMVCGATVVASCVTSLPEVVGSAGLLVDPTDTDEIATALYQGMTDTPLRASLQSEAKRQTSRFTWEQVAEQVIQVWKDTRG
jgi:glycosyltransferase involved in cell wall biosynthesis